MSESRHNPDQLLKEIQADEEKRNKGHLKIFFGYAAGVGKTYAMLEAAHMEKQKGIDVVAGYELLQTWRRFSPRRPRIPDRL